MKFKNINIKNFMGIESRSIDFGNTTIISGDNATGKTTVLSAITWCLFGKDYYDRTKFNIQPIDANGDVISKVTTVSLSIVSSDSEESVIVREYDGINNRFYIDEIPVKATEFNTYVSKLTDGADRFKLYTNPFYFFKFPQKEQRDMLMRFFPTPKDDVVLSRMNEMEYYCIEDLLKKNSPENIILMYKEKLSKYTKDSQETKAIIDSSEPASNFESVDYYNKQIDSINEELMKLEDRLNSVIDHNNRITLASAKISAAKEEIEKIKTRYENDKTRRIAEICYKLDSTNSEIIALGKMFDVCCTCGQKLTNNQISNNEALIDSLNNLANELEEQMKVIEKEPIPEIVKSQIKEYEDIIFNNEPTANLVRLDASDLLEKQKELNSLKEEYLIRLGMAKSIEERKGKIESLKKKYKELNIEKEESENIIRASEKFISTRSEVIVDILNNKFNNVQFQLFETLKDGSQKESFGVSFRGIPYDSLNKGSKLSVGVELSLFLQNGLGLSIPTIIDDGESYASEKYLNIPNQVIVTKVVEGKEFTVEIK